MIQVLRLIKTCIVLGFHFYHGKWYIEKKLRLGSKIFDLLRYFNWLINIITFSKKENVFFATEQGCVIARAFDQAGQLEGLTNQIS